MALGAILKYVGSVRIVRLVSVSIGFGVTKLLLPEAPLSVLVGTATRGQVFFAGFHNIKACFKGFLRAVSLDKLQIEMSSEEGADSVKNGGV